MICGLIHVAFGAAGREPSTTHSSGQMHFGSNTTRKWAGHRSDECRLCKCVVYRASRTSGTALFLQKPLDDGHGNAWPPSRDESPHGVQKIDASSQSQSASKPAVGGASACREWGRLSEAAGASAPSCCAFPSRKRRFAEKHQSGRLMVRCVLHGGGRCTSCEPCICCARWTCVCYSSALRPAIWERGFAKGSTRYGKFPGRIRRRCNREGLPSLIEESYEGCSDRGTKGPWQNPGASLGMPRAVACNSNVESVPILGVTAHSGHGVHVTLLERKWKRRSVELDE